MFFGLVSIVVLYALLLVYITWPIQEFSIDKAGVFGDSFGILTSLFSGLAFAALIVTILLQKKELSYQREELKLQREEIARNRKELARTASAQEKSEEWFALQARMMTLSAVTSVIELRRNAGHGFDRKLMDQHYEELVALLEKTKGI